MAAMNNPAIEVLPTARQYRIISGSPVRLVQALTHVQRPIHVRAGAGVDLAVQVMVGPVHLPGDPAVLADDLTLGANLTDVGRVGLSVQPHGGVLRPAVHAALDLLLEHVRIQQADKTLFFNYTMSNDTV